MPASNAPSPVLQDMDGCAVDLQAVVQATKVSLLDRIVGRVLFGAVRLMNPEGDRV